MYFDIHKNASGQYWFTAYGENSKKLCHSETYVAKASALHTIRLIKKDAAGSAIYDETGETGSPSDTASRLIE